MIKEQLSIIAKKIIPNRIRKSIRLIKLQATYLFIENGHHYCSVLDEPVKDFIPKGNKLFTHKNEALSRHRMLMDFLRTKSDFFGSDHNVLHIAAEDCLAEIFLRDEKVNYFPVDKFSAGYDYPDYVKNDDITNLSFEDSKFDTIICNHVLEHIPDDKLAMEEILRVLIPNGKAFITVPINTNSNSTLYDPKITSPKERKRLYGQWDHVRLYSLDIVDKLEDVGFKTIAIHYRSYIGNQEADRLGIQDDYLIIAEKK